MWFAGLVLGGLIGSMAGFGGAVFGAIVGAVTGGAFRAMLNQSRNSEQEQRLVEIETKIDHIYRSLGDIHNRLVRLEKPGDATAHAQGAASPSSYDAVVSPAPVTTATDHIGRNAGVLESEPSPAPVAAAMPVSQRTEPAIEVPAAATPAMPFETATQAQAAGPFVDESPQPQARADEAGPFVETLPQFQMPAWWHRLLSGNIVAKAGVIILFFGVGFLLKFAYEHDLLPVQLRLAAVGAAGIAMLAGGWRIRNHRRLYGLILQGAGVGVLYLDVFFAVRVYALVHPTIGFALFMLLGIAATLLAVRQDSRALATLGLTGAFMAPVLAGSREGNHVMLFGYYTLLNGFILLISWFKAWRELNLVGFIFTFIVGVFWGANNYRPELFATVEPFVLIFFAMYLVIPILFARRQPPELNGLVDGTLVFGTPVSAAFMQAALVRDIPNGLAWSATGAALLYAVLAVMVIRREGMRLLGETYIALATIFATMAIFFAFDAYPTFALWTLEGAAIVWVGLRQQRLLARLFGMLVQIGGAFLFLLHYADYARDNPWFNDFLLGCALIVTAAGITAWLMHKYRDVLIEGGQSASVAMLVWACCWWFAGGLHALRDGLPHADFHAAALIFTAITFALAETAGGWLEWTSMRRLTLAHLPAIVLGMLTIGTRHPLAGQGVVAWPLNFVVFFWCLHWQSRGDIATTYGARYRTGWFLLAALATWEGGWLIDHAEYQWSFLLGAAGIAAAFLRFHLRERNAEDAGRLSSWALLWGLAFWFASGWFYIDDRIAYEYHIACGLGFVVASSALFEILGTLVRWPGLRRTQLVLLPVMALAALMQSSRHLHPSAGEAGWAWLAAFAVFYAVIRRQQNADIVRGAALQHVFALWLGVGVIAWELAWQSASYNPATSWPFALWGAVPALALLVLSHFGSKAWPWRDDFPFYRNNALGPMAIYCVLWSVVSSWDSGSSGTAFYLPILNPIDLAQIGVMCGLRGWLAAGDDAARERESGFSTLLGALGFLWLNSIVLRTIHHWFGIPYVAHELFNSMVVQAAFSLLWTLTAMALMVLATRRLDRKPWFAGALLLAIVVGKLFLLDLANSGTVARIVSFLGVGGLLMVIGYVAPVPPGETEKQQG